MAIKYYSTVTRNYYDTAEALESAEKAVEEKKLQENEKKLARANAAKKVDEAYNAYMEAERNYVNTLSDFCKEYGYYHKTISSDNVDGVESFLTAFRRFMML